MKNIVDKIIERSLNEGFFNNIDAATAITALIINPKSFGLTKGSAVFWTLMYIFQEHNKLTTFDKDKLKEIAGRTYRMRNGKVAITACCSDYGYYDYAGEKHDKLVTNIGIRLLPEDENKPVFIRPVVQTMSGRKNYTADFTRILDRLNIKYITGNDATPREKSDKYTYIKLI